MCLLNNPSQQQIRLWAERGSRGKLWEESGTSWILRKEEIVNRLEVSLGIWWCTDHCLAWCWIQRIFWNFWVWCEMELQPAWVSCVKLATVPCSALDRAELQHIGVPITPNLKFNPKHNHNSIPKTNPNPKHLVNPSTNSNTNYNQTLTLKVT